MNENNEILKDLIEKSIELQNKPFEKYSENIREQIMLNRETIEPFETWNKSAEFEKKLIPELKFQQEKLINFLNNKWKPNIKHNLLRFDKIYQSESQIIIEWHAGNATPHLIRYYIHFENNGFFKLTSSKPEFSKESIENIKFLETNYRNIFKVGDNGEIEMKSEYFSLKGRIIENGIIDEKIILNKTKDRELIKEGILLTVIYE